MFSKRTKKTNAAMGVSVLGVFYPLVSLDDDDDVCKTYTKTIHIMPFSDYVLTNSKLHLQVCTARLQLQRHIMYRWPFKTKYSNI